MRLRIDVNKDGTKNYYILESFRTDDKKTTTRIVKKLGNHEDILKEHEDPEAWAREQVENMNQLAKEGKQKIMVPFSPGKVIDKDEDRLFDGGYLFIQKLFYQLHLDYICKLISSNRKFKYNLADILGDLIYARVLNPLSKLATYEYVQTFLEKPTYSIDDVYRSLAVLGEEKDFIQSELYKYSKGFGNRNDGILYYDCTNYYFEIEEERGQAKYGPGKDHKPNPIIQMGLFMDADGIPMSFCLEDGNTNEQKTLRPLEEQIMKDFKHSKFIVCTDAGLSSTANRKFNNIGDRAFVTTQSIKKMKDFQKEWALSPKGWCLPGSNKKYNLDDIISDEKLCEKYRLSTFYKEEWFNENDIEQKYIVTFSLKYREYQRKIRDNQLARAQKALDSNVKSDRTRQSDYKRFIKKVPVTDEGEVAGNSLYTLNDNLVQEESKYDGFYAVATNLDDPAVEIIKINHRRWEIEECFRIMKNEFCARPVYVNKDQSITAHFTVCFLALVLFRYLEKAMGHEYTCNQIINELRQIKFFKLKDVGYSPAYTRNAFTDKLHEVYGFRTDYEVISKASMRKIISQSKKR